MRLARLSFGHMYLRTHTLLLLLLEERVTWPLQVSLAEWTLC